MRHDLRNAHTMRTDIDSRLGTVTHSARFLMMTYTRDSAFAKGKAYLDLGTPGYWTHNDAFTIPQHFLLRNDVIGQTRPYHHEPPYAELQEAYTRGWILSDLMTVPYYSSDST